MLKEQEACVTEQKGSFTTLTTFVRLPAARFASTFMLAFARSFCVFVPFISRRSFFHPATSNADGCRHLFISCLYMYGKGKMCAFRDGRKDKERKVRRSGNIIPESAAARKGMWGSLRKMQRGLCMRSQSTHKSPEEKFIIIKRDVVQYLFREYEIAFFPPSPSEPRVFFLLLLHQVFIIFLPICHFIDFAILPLLVPP